MDRERIAAYQAHGPHSQEGDAWTRASLQAHSLTESAVFLTTFESFKCLRLEFWYSIASSWFTCCIRFVLDLFSSTSGFISLL